jgi:crossover junction endodeoxyribonuclease RusA
VLKVELPFPTSGLMPNRAKGTHWAQTHQARGKAFNDAHVLTFDAMRRHTGKWHPTNGQVPVTLTFHAPDRRKRDLDNLLAACKPMLDGVAAALLMDDREFEPVTLKRGDVKKGGAVVLEVGA